MTSIAVALRDAAASIQEISHTPRLDAELLLAEVLGCDRMLLIRESERELLSIEFESFEKLIARRQQHEPVAYIRGRKEFWGLEFLVTPDVLIPRPETEHLVERVLERLLQEQVPVTVIEIGTGSGCISIALAYEFRKRDLKHQLIASDISFAALSVAQKNARKHSVAGSISFVQADLLSVFAHNCALMIISNPPYVSSSLSSHPSLSHEPKAALFAVDDGLSIQKELILGAPEVLTGSGVLYLEIGAEQHEPLSLYVDNVPERAAYRRLQFYEDMAGHKRVCELARAL